MKNEQFRDTGNIRGTKQHNYKQTSNNKKMKKEGNTTREAKEWPTHLLVDNANQSQQREVPLLLKLRSTSKGNDKN